MERQEKRISRLRRPFVITGGAVGVALSAWYLCNNFGRTTSVPDPIWARFVNIALLIFAPIYLANLLRRLVELFFKRKAE